MNLAQTEKFIQSAHKGQKYGIQDYWRHPKAVMIFGKQFFGSKFTEDAKHVALLHDTIEDTQYTLNDLLGMGYSKEIVDAVSLLTKDKSLSYEQNIQKIISSGNMVAMMVKYSDNAMNFAGDKSKWEASKREKSQKKYAWSLNTLGTKLGVKK